MSERDSQRFDVNSHPEFTIARITGDNLPSPQEFAADHSESELHDLVTRIDDKLLDLQEKALEIESEMTRMKRARSLAATALPLAREKGIE